jgi:hypothetical protein
MPDRPTVMKTLAALVVASVGIVIISGGGVAAFGIGVFLLINAVLLLGTLLWA